ncbi:MAG: AMP-binding protein [Candidatus Krumholzibacteriia bacterium]
MKRGISVEALVREGLADAEARAVVDYLDATTGQTPAPMQWRHLTTHFLSPAVPFGAHLLVHDAVYRDWDNSQGPPPAWSPTPEQVRTSNIDSFCRRAGIAIPELHSWSIRDREAFWTAVVRALGIVFAAAPARTLDPASGAESPAWLPGARLNIAASCFRARGDEDAVIYRAEGGETRRMTYDGLDRLSNRVANSLLSTGFKTGDAVAIAMPMTLEAVAAYLGIVKAGCVVVSVADSFAADEIGTRLRLSNARGVVTQDVTLRAGKELPMYQKVIDAGAPTAIVVTTRDGAEVSLRDGDHAWNEFLSDNESFGSVPCNPGDVTNILFSSGTTGEPKAIPWTHATPIKCAMDGYLHHDIKPGDVVAWPTNLGWMMGPWLIYATLINRGTIALYYGAPNTAEFCRFVAEAKVNMLGVVPSLVKAWRSTGVVEGLDWTSIKAFSSTGEASGAEDMLYLMSLAGYRPVIEYCGGTEIGGGYITGTVVQAASPATFSTIAFGLDMVVLDGDGRPARNGEIFLVPPSIGLSLELLNRDHHEVYYAGTPTGPNGELLRRHGDQMERLGGGYYQAHGRADDTMNLGGIKISAAELERVAGTVAGIVEVAAIAVSPPGGGPSLLVVYAVPETGADVKNDALIGAMQKAISSGLNPLFRVHDVVRIDALPRTASNKVMRRVLRDRYTASGGG